MQLKILLLNGPPRSGKDTLAEGLKWAMPDTHLEKFAKPLKEAAPVIYGIDRKLWSDYYDASANKDLPAPAFFGKSPRQVQIAISEALLKPLHGAEVFGRLLVNRLSSLPPAPTVPRLVVVSDSGFQAEALELVREFGAANILLCRLHRDGCTFAGDSRSHLSLVDYGVREVDLLNLSDELDLVERGQKLVEAFMLPRECRNLDGSIVAEPAEAWQARISNALKFWESEYANKAIYSDQSADTNSTRGGGSW